MPWTERREWGDSLNTSEAQRLAIQRISVCESVFAAICAPEPARDTESRQGGTQIILKARTGIAALHNDPGRCPPCDVARWRGWSQNPTTPTTATSPPNVHMNTPHHRATLAACQRLPSYRINPFFFACCCAVLTACFHFFPNLLPSITRSIVSSHSSG